MVTNTQGQIALKWTINPNGKTVQMQGTEQYYVFIPKYHVVMAWVNPEHVDALLAKKEKTCMCNNGTYKNAFAYANLLDVNLWETGDRHGKLTVTHYREVADGT
jgi:hypothetical protein